MANPESKVPRDNLDLYDKLVATQPGVERKGATMPFTSLNGHMFSFLTAEGKLALRLSAEDRVAFLTKFKTKLMEQQGAVLKEYVTVPDALLKKTRELAPYFANSITYIQTLKSKATKKSRKAQYSAKSP